MAVFAVLPACLISLRGRNLTISTCNVGRAIQLEHGAPRSARAHAASIVVNVIGLFSLHEWRYFILFDDVGRESGLGPLSPNHVLPQVTAVKRAFLGDVGAGKYLIAAA